MTSVIVRGEKRKRHTEVHVEMEAEIGIMLICIIFNIPHIRDVIYLSFSDLTQNSNL